MTLDEAKELLQVHNIRFWRIVSLLYLYARCKITINAAERDENMKEKNKNVIKNYFSDCISWIAAITLLFSAALIIDTMNNGSNHSIWLISPLFLIAYLFQLPLLVLYIKSKIDLKNGFIQTAIISISDLQRDDKHSFSRSGKTKYKLFDTDNNTYLLSLSNEKDFFDGFCPSPDFSVEIEYLNTSKLVLSMKIIEYPRKSKKYLEQIGNINHFKKDFKIYF